MTYKIPSELAALQRYACVAILEDGEPFAEFTFANSGRWVQFGHVARAWSQREALLRICLSMCIDELEIIGREYGIAVINVERTRTLLGDSHER